MENSKQKFTSNTIWSLIGRVFQVGVTFITTMLIARYLGPEKHGIITLSYSYVYIFTSIASLGLNDIVVKELLDKDNDKSEVLGTMLTLKTIASLLSIGLVYLVITSINDSSIVVTITMLQSLSLLFQICDSLTYYYQSELLFKKVAIITIISYGLTTIFRIVGLINKYDTEWFAIAVSLDFLLVSVINMIAYFGDGNKLKFSKKMVKPLLAKSYNYIFASVMINIYSRADTIILGEMINETNVGYYNAATTICNAWPIILLAIIDSARPIIIDLYENNRKEYEKRYKQLYASIFYISVAVAIVFIVFSNLIISIIYGKEYMPATLPLKIVCLGTAFSYFGVARGIWMQCENKIKYEKIIYLLGAIINIVLNLILIRLYGIAGAAIAIALTQFFTNFVVIYLIKETRDNAKLMIDGILLKGVFK